MAGPKANKHRPTHKDTLKSILYALQNTYSASLSILVDDDKRKKNIKIHRI